MAVIAKLKIGMLAALTATLFPASRGPAASTAEEEPGVMKRSREWLVEYVTQPIPDTPRNRRYLRLIDQNLDDTYLGLDVAWLQTGGEDPYRSRYEINAIGCLAFCYRTKELRYYRDPTLLAKLRAALRAVAHHVNDEGMFAWPGYESFYRKGSHEHAWRLEPLLLASIWLGDSLPSEERRLLENALQRAAKWLVRHPLTQTNNRGAVWCAVTTLCGAYYDDPRYADVVEQYADDVMNTVVLGDGEVGEHTEQYAGGGPDSNYTYTGFSYVYLYRLLSGKVGMDPRLHRALRWLAQYTTLSGWPNVAGASVRVAHSKARIQDALPAFEFFAGAEPFFATVADSHVKRAETHDPRCFNSHQHIVSPLIWAMLAAGPSAHAGPHPDWYVNHTRIYEHPNVHYALVGRAYQTGVTFRARAGEYRDIPLEGLHLRGMQTFAFAGEDPIVTHTQGANSTTRADGVDTAVTNVDTGPSGWEVVLTRGEMLREWRSGLAAITTRRRSLWTIYAYTPVSAVVVYGGARGAITTEWLMPREMVPKPTLDTGARRVRFDGLQGRLYLLAGDATLQKTGEGDQKRYVLEVVAEPPLSVFGFSNESFRFGRLDAHGQELLFSDASGSYSLSFAGVVGPDGNIDRDVPMRLLRLSP